MKSNSIAVSSNTSQWSASDCIWDLCGVIIWLKGLLKLFFLDLQVEWTVKNWTAVSGCRYWIGAIEKLHRMNGGMKVLCVFFCSVWNNRWYSSSLKGQFTQIWTCAGDLLILRAIKMNIMNIRKDLKPVIGDKQNASQKLNIQA